MHKDRKQWCSEVARVYRYCEKPGVYSRSNLGHAERGKADCAKKCTVCNISQDSALVP